jgi:hypothetical protein
MVHREHRLDRSNVERHVDEIENASPNWHPSQLPRYERWSISTTRAPGLLDQSREKLPDGLVIEPGELELVTCVANRCVQRHSRVGPASAKRADERTAEAAPRTHCKTGKAPGQFGKVFDSLVHAWTPVEDCASQDLFSLVGNSSHGRIRRAT